MSDKYRDMEEQEGWDEVDSLFTTAVKIAAIGVGVAVTGGAALIPGTIAMGAVAGKDLADSHRRESERNGD